MVALVILASFASFAVFGVLLWGKVILFEKDSGETVRMLHILLIIFGCYAMSASDWRWLLGPTQILEEQVQDSSADTQSDELTNMEDVSTQVDEVSVEET